MVELKRQEILKLFLDFELLCLDCFIQVRLLRVKINNGTIESSDISQFERMFKEGHERYSSLETEHKSIDGFLGKVKLFFLANEFYAGNMMSKGKINFFEYSTFNYCEYGMKEKYLSLMNKNMEIAWFGALQKYGKLVLIIAKNNN